MDRLSLTEYFALKTVDGWDVTRRAHGNPNEDAAQDVVARWGSLQMAWFDWIDTLPEEHRETLKMWVVYLIDMDQDEALTQFYAWHDEARGK